MGTFKPDHWSSAAQRRRSLNSPWRRKDACDTPKAREAARAYAERKRQETPK